MHKTSTIYEWWICDTWQDGSSMASINLGLENFEKMLTLTVQKFFIYQIHACQHFLNKKKILWNKVSSLWQTLVP